MNFWHRPLSSLKASLILGILAALLTIMWVYGATFLYPHYQAHSERGAMISGIATELSRLQKEGNEVALLPDFIDALAKGDSYEILGIMVRERDARGIGLMGVTDEEGYVIARTKTVSARGDNAFLATPIGRALAGGQSHVSSVEVSGLNPSQILFGTGRWVYKNSTKVGALFSNALADNQFSQTFAERYLSSNTEVAFYTRQYGIYGSSFEKEEDRSLIGSFIHPNSRFVRVGMDNLGIEFPDGRRYIVRNYVFPGLESSPGGALIFYPIESSQTSILILLIPLIIVFVIAVTLHYRSSSERKMRHYSLQLAFNIFVILCVTFIIYFYVEKSFIHIESAPSPLYNSTLRFQQESGVFSSHFPRDLNILLDSGEEAINAIAASITYNPSIIRIEAVNFETSICKNFIKQSIDSVVGTVNIECIIPSPGYKGNSGVIATLQIVPQKDGVAIFRFDKESKVLANDGAGTNVLRATTDASLIFNSSVDASFTATDPALFSSSHPNMARWYSNKTISLSWLPSSMPVLLQIKDSTGATLLSVQKNRPPFKYSTSRDGIYTVELQLASSKTVHSFKFQIDTTRPTLSVKPLKTLVTKGEVLPIRVEGSDESSGLQRAFYLSVDDGLFYPIGSEIHIPFYEAGRHSVVVRAFDNAGNYRDVKTTIRVE